MQRFSYRWIAPHDIIGRLTLAEAVSELAKDGSRIVQVFTDNIVGSNLYASNVGIRTNGWSILVEEPYLF